MADIPQRLIQIAQAAALVLLLSLQPVLAEDLTRQDAIREAQDRNGGGKVLGVSESRKNGKLTYKVKLISDGKVRVIRVPASRD